VCALRGVAKRRQRAPAVAVTRARGPGEARGSRDARDRTTRAREAAMDRRPLGICRSRARRAPPGRLLDLRGIEGRDDVSSTVHRLLFDPAATPTASITKPTAPVRLTRCRERLRGLALRGATLLAGDGFAPAAACSASTPAGGGLLHAAPGSGAAADVAGTRTAVLGRTGSSWARSPPARRPVAEYWRPIRWPGASPSSAPCNKTRVVAGGTSPSASRPRTERVYLTDYAATRTRTGRGALTLVAGVWQVATASTLDFSTATYGRTTDGDLLLRRAHERQPHASPCAATRPR